MHLDGRTRPRLGTAANRLYRWLAVLFPISIAGSVFGQSYLAPPPGFGGAPAVPAMGNVTPSGGPADGQINSRTADQLNAQINGDQNGQPNTQTQLNAPPNAQLNGQSTAQPNSQTASSSPGEGKTSGAATPPLTAPVDSLMQWGALHLRARAAYQFLYSTGIQSAPGKTTDTYTHTISPGLRFDLGPHVSLDYSAAIRFFSQRDFHDTVDHSASLTASFGYGDWGFGMAQSFTASDEPMVQTGSQTDEKTYSAGVSAVYHVNDKVSIGTGLGVALTFLGGGETNVFVGHGTNAFASPLSDSQGYSGSERISYEFNDKVSGGVGATVSYAEQSGGFRSVDETFDGNLAWHPGKKLSASASAGFEHQHFLGADSSDSWSPIYSANVAYHVIEPTTVSIYANRSAGTSLFQNQAVEYTGVGIGLQQRLLGKLQLSLGFGYTRADYETTTDNLATSRSDSGTSYSAGLSMAFLKHCNVAAFYSYSQNDSTTSGFGYASSQVGMTLSWAY